MSSRMTKKKAHYLAKRLTELEKIYPVLGHRMCSIQDIADCIYMNPHKFGDWIGDRCIECIPHKDKKEFDALNELHVLAYHPEYIDFIFNSEQL